MINILKSKSELRDIYKQKRKEITPSEADFANEIILDNLISSEIYNRADSLLLYSPIGNEVNTLIIAQRALADGKKIVYPISNKDSFSLDFRLVDSPCDLVAGAYSILEPSKDREKYIGTRNDICIVPGLAFDRNGYRIGYGKGFYDRFLAGFCGISVGLVYSQFLCDVLPRDSTDLPVKLIISEKEVIYL